jgi:thiamine pyrophosphate-dependent acetolactate synthase large subunit-like protein
MGGGLPGALSACISQPGKKVVSLVGDGGLLMSLSEIATAVKYQLPVTVVVANNHQYNLEKNKMEVKGLTPFGCDITVPDFATLAKSFGAEGSNVTEPQQLENVLREGISSDKPFVVDVHLDQISLPFLK